MIEKTGIALGTVKRVIEELKEKGYIKREGSNKTGYWKLLKSTSGTINGTINGTLNLILKEIENKKNITQKELVERIGISLRTVKRVIEELKEKGYIKREGSNRIGYRVILKNS